MSTETSVSRPLVAPPGWDLDEAPFHPGEISVQTQAGVRDKAEVGGRRGIRRYMPDQHRQFFSQLPFIVLGGVDVGGQPWATLRMGEPGFVSSSDATTLHIAGEFTEDNLGTAAESDGSVTVRVVGQQYSFTPQCILVPDRTPVTFRVTSADVIHGFLIAETNVNVMLEPGYISTFRTTFRHPGTHVMPCHEYCSVGHAGMWARVQVIDRETFFRQASSQRRQSCVPR